MPSNYPPRRHVPIRLATVALLAVAVTACSSPKPPPPPPPPTKVNVTLAAAADANATPDGQGAPVVVRVYQLGSTAAFDNAEFFQLYHHDSATLGPDLIKKDEVLLAPGTSKDFSYQPADTVHAIGIFAAYADFQQVTWRADTPVEPHKTTTVTVTAGRAGITLTAKSGTP